MRDKETILTAIEAAESGHLVLSTLHTGSTASTIDRIISYFSDEEKNHICSKLSMILSVVVSQQLLVGKTYDTIYPCQEIMFMNDSIRNLIREGKDPTTIYVTKYIVSYKLERIMVVLL